MDTGQINNQIHLPAREILDVNGIERELNHLWTSAAVGDKDDDGSVMRARVLNLLVHVDSDAALQTVNALLPDVTAAHPCRAIVMMGDEKGADQDIEVYLSLQCRPVLSAHDRRLCCEAVTLEARGRFAVELPSAATPLMVPDLPAILWWHGDVEFDDPVFRTLNRVMNRVVFDSANFAETHHDIEGLVEFWDRQRATDARLSDLNWNRHSAWRSLIAAFFDGPENRLQLDRLERVEIDCIRPTSDPTAVPPQGLILAGWFAGCLGWTTRPDAPLLQVNDTWQITLVGQDREVQFVWRFVDHADPGECEIVRVELICSENDDAAHFEVALSSNGYHLETDTKGDSITRAPRVLNCPNTDTAHLLAAELNAGGQDLVLERSVRAAAAMIGPRS
ncbi:MAG: glucose-6-phosphate dehydrogenase assembly protein OpcA [Pyrinomonadaceae bacterium]